MQACGVMSALGRGTFHVLIKLLRPDFMLTDEGCLGGVMFEMDLAKKLVNLRKKSDSFVKDESPKECIEAGGISQNIKNILFEPSHKEIRIELEHDEACRLMRACEIIARIGMGQFKDMIELFNPKLNWDEQAVIERDLKERLFPEVGQGYYAMHSNKCPEECKVAWDCYQHIRREISWYGMGKDWRKDQREFCNGMRGVNFDEPFKVSKLPGDFKTERIG